MRGTSLARCLMLLTAALLLPSMLLGSGMLWMQYRADRARAEAQLVEQARSMARLVDREFARAEGVALALAASDALARGDLDTFDGEMRTTNDLLSGGLPTGEKNKIAFFDEEGMRRLYTVWPRGGRRTGGRGLPYVLDAISSGWPQDSDLINDPASGPPCAAVAVPVFAPAPGGDGPRVAGVVAVTVARERLLDIAGGAGLPWGGFASVLDRKGTVVARSFRDAETLGKLPMPAVLDAVMGAEAGLAPRGTPTLEGVPSTIAFAHAPRSGFVVKADVPDAVFLAPFRASLLRTAGIGTAILAAGLVLAMLVARQVVAAFRGVSQAALDGMARGGAAPALTGLREADELAASLSSALAERERASASVRAMLESSPVGVVISDTGGRVHEANDAFLAIVGRSRAELGTGAVRWEEAAIAEAVATGRCTPYEKEYVRPDGARVPVLMSFGLTDRAAGLAAVFVVDLTRMRDAEAARRESEARFRVITDAMPQMVWSMRPDGHTDYANQRWHGMTGRTPEQMREEGWAPLVHPDDRERFWTQWRQALAAGTPYDCEHRLRMADGAYRWVLGRALPVRGAPDAEHPEGRILRWFGTCTDIEEIVDAREVLARSRRDLEQLVEDRTRDLEATQARLAHVRRMEALGQLAGGIAHDFNNVLQAVQGGAALIERRPADLEGVRRLARMVFEAAGRGSAITRRLLAFSRQGDLRAEAVDPGALLTDMRELLMHTLGAGVGVRVEATAGVPPLLADKGQLETVLVNLATNARDAMAGSGTLALAAAAEVVRHDGGPGYPPSLKAGSYVRLSVTDTGAGMTPEVLARVTEPFFTTKPQGKGTGLGLAMARGFAEQSGGGLHLDSAPGRGTTVKLWLPLAGGAPDAARPPGPKDADMGQEKRARLLVADDDEIVREIVTEQLEAAGYAVLAARGGPEALAMLDARESVDLVVSDLSMPGMDGMALVREAQRRRPRLPAILLTGFATNAAEIAVGGAVGGTFTLLRKPVEGKVLAERVAVLLEGMAAAVGAAG